MQGQPRDRALKVQSILRAMLVGAFAQDPHVFVLTRPAASRTLRSAARG